MYRVVCQGAFITRHHGIRVNLIKIGWHDRSLARMLDIASPGTETAIDAATRPYDYLHTMLRANGLTSSIVHERRVLSHEQCV